MSWIGPAISAAGSLLGGMLSGKSQREANESNERLQREFAQNGIRWKVEDAKAAGLHPLFALGGSGATFTPSAQPVMDGQNVARAANAAASYFERGVQEAQLEALKAQANKDNALAAAAHSEAARNAQAGRASSPVLSQQDIEWFTAKGMPIPGQAQSFPIADPQTVVTPLEPIPKSSAYLTNASGPAEPSLKRWGFPGLGEFIGPNASNFGESMESIENLGLQAMIIYANLEHYGKNKTSEMVRKLSRSQWWSAPWEEAAKAAGVWLDSHRR